METTDEKKCCESGKCGCPCHKMPGVFLVLLGVAILLTGLEWVSLKAGMIASAVLVMLLGLQKIFAGACKCCAGAGDGTCEKK